MIAMTRQKTVYCGTNQLLFRRVVHVPLGFAVWGSLFLLMEFKRSEMDLASTKWKSCALRFLRGGTICSNETELVEWDSIV